MQKKKDGTVIASLTEVKNKTGDIFALADEFGEVILTSYNKPRYKIVKLDISNVLDLSEKEPKGSKQDKIESRVEEIEPESEKGMIDRSINVSSWDRNNAKETAFTASATKSLLN